jgi:hypothetical protein
MADINQLQYDVLMAQDIRFDPNDDQPNYIGLNANTNGDTSAVGWIIYKFTYSGSDVIRIQKTKGIWDDRATLF